MTEQLAMKFEELTNEQKDLAIEKWHGDMSVEYDHYTEYLTEQVREHFDSADLNVQWELHSQGSGLNIHGKIYYCDLLNKPELVEGFTPKEIARITYYTENGANYMMIPANYHYGYCMVDSVDIADDIISYLGEHRDLDVELIERFETAVKNYINKYCGKLYSDTQMWEHETWSHEYLKELADANDYLFSATGEIVG